MPTTSPSEMREILEDIRGNDAILWTDINRMIEAIVADMRIGILPTRSELLAMRFSGKNGMARQHSKPTIDALIAAGYAREDDEPMTTPDPDSAAVDAIAVVLVSEGIYPSVAEPAARAVLAHLREHPEHLGIEMVADHE